MGAIREHQQEEAPEESAPAATPAPAPQMPVPRFSPQALTAAGVLALQRLVGNAAVAELIGGQERERDRGADAGGEAQGGSPANGDGGDRAPDGGAAGETHADVLGAPAPSTLNGAGADAGVADGVAAGGGGGAPVADGGAGAGGGAVRAGAGEVGGAAQAVAGDGAGAVAGEVGRAAQAVAGGGAGEVGGAAQAVAGGAAGAVAGAAAGAAGAVAGAPGVVGAVAAGAAGAVAGPPGAAGTVAGGPTAAAGAPGGAGVASGQAEGGAKAAAAAPAAAPAAPAAPGADEVRDPHDDPGFKAMKGAARGAGGRAKAHQPAAAGVAGAHGAAAPPGNDTASQAAAAQVDEMGKQQPGVFDKKAFVAAVKKAIDAASPKNLEEAQDFKGSGKAGKAKDEVQGLVKGGKKESEKNIKEKAEAQPDTSKAKPKPVTPMVHDEPGAAPAGVGAAEAMPKPKPGTQTDLSAGPAKVDSAMADADVTDEQLKNSNEPEFTGALKARDAAKDHSDKAPAEYRDKEKDVLGKGRAEAEGKAGAHLGAMHGARTKGLAKAVAHKTAAKSEDEKKRAKVASDIQAIYDKTKGDVTKTLEALDGKVDAAFTKGEGAARAQFEEYVDKQMTAYKDERYSGLLGKGRWIKDKFAGMPDEVNRFYEQGKAKYLASMDGVIGEVADIVGKELTAARARITEGRAEVQKYVAQLPADLKEVGKEAEGKLESQFDQLSSEVDSKQDALVDSLAQKYVEARDKLDSRIEELQAANKGFVSKALDAVVGVVKTILKLKDMLLNVLAKAAGVVGEIIKDPIGFLGNLISGIKGGVMAFMANIGTHLQQGLMGWLFGALGSAGITMPKSLDFRGILDLVLQILGLTWQNVKLRIVKAVGAPLMEKMEGTVGVFKDFATKGIAGAWEWIKDKLGNLEEMVLEPIKSFVTEKIVKSGIMWIVSLLNPASAFIKACKAIYDIVMFVVERGAEMMEFVGAVIDSIGAVAKGGIGTMISKIEGVLAKALPLAISFLASLLGLGGISEKIRSIIDTVRAPINKAIDFVVGGAIKTFKSMFKGAIGWVKGKVAKGKAFVKGKVDAGKKFVKGKVQGVKDRLRGGAKTDATPSKSPDAKSDPEADGAPAPMPDVVVPFDMDGAGHTLTVREEGDTVDVIMASDPLPFTTKFRSFHTELDDWRHYLESIRERMPPDVQAQIDAKLKHLKNIRGSQIAKYKQAYDATFGSRKERIEGHQDPNREKEGLRKLRELAEADAAALKAWAAESDIEDISKAALDGSFRTLGRTAYAAALKHRRETVDGILAGFTTPNGAPVRYRGSLEEGQRNPSKAGVRFDPDDFDLDLYVVDPAWHAAILAQRPALRGEFAGKVLPARTAGGAAAELQARVVDALEKKDAVPGLRKGANYILIRPSAP